MSNAQATKLYEYVIEEVISGSREDFENSGIDESTLQELRRIWCDKLSQSKVAKFGWEDEEQHPNTNINAITSNTTNHNTSINNNNNNDNNNNNNINNNNDLLGGPELSYATNNDVAPELTEEASDNGLQIPTIIPSVDTTGGLMLPNLSQTDGTFEFTIETDQASDLWKGLKKHTIAEKKQLLLKRIKQNDGPDDDDDDEDDSDIFNDSDDINSDLDEGLESEKSDDEDADQEGQIMLCLYDKVQRVKNKWKSNLKEGVANINGKDYVFQKATGECEW